MNNNVITASEISKVYTLYDKPIDRLKESLSITRKEYGVKYHALKDVSFEIKKGDTVGIIGGNGAGKSTLLKIITGVLSPTNGSIDIRGKVSAILELGAGFNTEYTGLQNIYLNGTMSGYSKEEMEKRIDKIMQFADIGEFIYQPVKTYSSGMFARLAFAVAINVDPDILIVDEVLAVGDVRFQTKCIDKMKELQEQGTTIIFVSHSSDQVKRFCNNAIWLDKGTVKEIGDASIIVDMYEEFMDSASISNDIPVDNEEAIAEEQEKNMDLQLEDKKMLNVIGDINNVTINNKMFNTFNTLEVTIEYEMFEEIADILLGVAILTKEKRNYIFGPNTYLEKVKIPNSIGKHVVKYTIPKLNLLSGSYTIDVGLFNNKGLVCIDYKEDIISFNIVNKYFSEGLCYLEHEWKVKE
ncbi:ABC transporter ATP-binding protein [Clostridium beijerinckii]|uniref:ABC transporter ATP-binding protein n=1 Tax=Clostridium beijerinckii TaxID=1520 RepID=A0A7X9SLU7_CLOBE|nr:ABC transporter ATP-binding protein [Clostridium beijerinckii]NMF04275.1 ABC transporter ATP-binding protein [Clostridium beijerinckii]